MNKTIQLLLKVQGVSKLLGVREIKDNITSMFIDVKMKNGKYRMYEIVYTETYIISSNSGFDLDDCFIEFDTYEDIINNLKSSKEQDSIHNTRLEYYKLLCNSIAKGICKLEGVFSARLYTSPEPIIIVHYTLNGTVQEPLYVYPFRKKFNVTNNLTDSILKLLEER